VVTGWAYSPYFVEIMEGVDNALAAKHIPDVEARQDWLAGPLGRRADKACGICTLEVHSCAI
jgi:hypothetical protein